MSDGTTGDVGVAESGSPTAEVEVSVMPDGRFRQRVDAVRVAELLEDVLRLLGNLVGRLPFPDVLTGRPQAPTSTPTTITSGTVTTVTGVTTVTTVSSVTAVAGVTAIGGIPASFDQIAAANAGALANRSRIAVT